MSYSSEKKKYNLEDRTFDFAKKVRDYVKSLPANVSNKEYSKQLVRSAGSQAANYIEANEASTKKDFLYRVRVSKKETKETKLWLKLTEPPQNGKNKKESLITEANELMRIFGAIIEKCN